MRSRIQSAPFRQGIGRLEVIVAVVVVVIIASVAITWLISRQPEGGGVPGASNLSPEELHKKQRANYQTVRNNLKQLALACQNHNDTFKTFPPLYFSNDPKLKGKMNVTKVKGAYPWTVRLLPFIEEDSIYKGISAKSSKFTTSSEAVKIDHHGKQLSPREIDLPQLQSPHLEERKVPGNNNYVALSATRLPMLLLVTEGSTGDTVKFPPDGMICPDKQSRGSSMARMADGTSKTAVICESRELEKSNWYEPTQSFVCGFLPADCEVNGDKLLPSFDGATWTPSSKGNDRTALDFGPTKEDAKRVYNAAAGSLQRTWGPSGGHPIGTMILHAMGDGSVLAVSSDIDPKVYFALITTRGGENVPRPDEAQIK